MNGRIRCVLIAVLTLASTALGALDLRDGRILFSLDEKTARFTVQYLADAARNNYIPLLYDKGPRTSFSTLFWNGKTYRLDESTDFRFTVKKEGSNAVVEYRSSFANIRQVFRMARSQDSADVNGMFIEFSIENISGSSASVGLRLLWDTYLGERSKRHFEIAGKGVISGETYFSGASIPNSVVSPGDSSAALQIQLIGEGISRPDSLVLANWKRINDSGWSFEPSAGRGFTLLPYSIDDSAVALYFEPKELRDGATRAIRTVIGNLTDQGYSTSLTITGENSNSIMSISEPAAAAGNPVLTTDSNPYVTARTDIAALREILSKIDQLLASGKDPSKEQLNELRTLLQRIRNRGKGL